MSNRDYYGGQQPTYTTPAGNGYYGAQSYPAQPQYASNPPQHSSGASPYNTAPQQPSYSNDNNSYRASSQPGAVPADGEKGLGATIVGGSGAAYAAHKAGAGFLGSTGAAIAGAIGANFLEHKFLKTDKKKKKKRCH